MSPESNLSCIEADLLEVAVDLDTLRQTSLGSIDGCVWFVINGAPFPFEGWFDWIIEALNRWLADLTAFSVLGAPGDSRDLWFMDGPQGVRLTVLGPNRWSAEFFDDIRSGRVVDQSTIDAAHFLRSLRRAGRRVLYRCRELGFDDEEVDDLERWLR